MQAEREGLAQLLQGDEKMVGKQLHLADQLLLDLQSRLVPQVHEDLLWVLRQQVVEKQMYCARSCPDVGLQHLLGEGE